MPGACGCPELQGRSVVASLAVCVLWLAVSFQDSGSATRGTDAATSAELQGVFRDAVAARSRATSAGWISAERLPKALRT